MSDYLKDLKGLRYKLGKLRGTADISEYEYSSRLFPVRVAIDALEQAERLRAQVAAGEAFVEVFRPMVAAWGQKNAETCSDDEFEAVLKLAAWDAAKEGA